MESCGGREGDGAMTDDLPKHVLLIDEHDPPKHVLALFSYQQKFGADAATALLRSYGVTYLGELDPKCFESFYDDCCRAVFAGTKLARKTEKSTC
jgi:hypothetical protein